MEFQITTFTNQLSTSGIIFILIFLAEFGDKSQLVCMTLAAKYRPKPILLGAITGFAILNLLAVMFGSVVASWIPEFWLALVVAGLFAFFGVQSLLANDDSADEDKTELRSNHSLFISALALIFVAEFGDKTQLAVAGLASTYQVLVVWIGATLALVATTTLGVLVGQRLLKRFSMRLIHKISGVLFLSLALMAVYKALILT